MKDHGDEMYSELNGSLLDKFNSKKDKEKNSIILKNLVENLNLNKCTLQEIELSHPNSINYLVYLLQSKNEIEFGLCQKYKCWFNGEGFQQRCKKDEGCNKTKKINCQGDLNRCERK